MKKEVWQVNPREKAQTHSDNPHARRPTHKTSRTIFTSTRYKFLTCLTKWTRLVTFCFDCQPGPKPVSDQPVSRYRAFIFLITILFSIPRPYSTIRMKKEKENGCRRSSHCDGRFSWRRNFFWRLYVCERCMNGPRKANYWMSDLWMHVCIHFPSGLKLFDPRPPWWNEIGQFHWRVYMQVFLITWFTAHQNTRSWRNKLRKNQKKVSFCSL